MAAERMSDEPWPDYCPPFVVSCDKTPDFDPETETLVVYSEWRFPLTSDQINALVPGPEVDRLVAEALGWKNSDVDGVVLVGGPGYGGPPEPMFFRPSTDFTAAMQAAEAFGLFDRESCVFSRMFGVQLGRWAVTQMPDEEIVSEADTGPMCICVAILTLHDSK